MKRELSEPHDADPNCTKPTMIRKIMCVLAVPMLIVGLITLPMPIPTGAVLIVVSVGMLVWGSDRVAGWMRILRQRKPGVDSAIRAVLLRLPHKLRSPVEKALRRSDPLDPDT